MDVVLFDRRRARGQADTCNPGWLPVYLGRTFGLAQCRDGSPSSRRNVIRGAAAGVTSGFEGVQLPVSTKVGR
jgi:hypothetical protein